MDSKVEYVRTGHAIKNMATGEMVRLDSISKAKRWSREWQKANGGLGIGKLRVECLVLDERLGFVR